MPLQLAEFDASAYLDNEEVIAEYLTAVLEDGGPDLFPSGGGKRRQGPGTDGAGHRRV